MNRRLITIFVLARVTLFSGVSCLPTQPPPPPSDGGIPMVTPSGWTRTARLASTVGRGLIPVAQMVTDNIVAEPGRSQVRRAFGIADQALVSLNLAASAYEARGGDRCAAFAAAGAASIALHDLAQVLTDNGVALGEPLGRVVDLVASVVDALIPSCAVDAGFFGAGELANRQLRAVERTASARGVILRRDLDNIAPSIDAGVR